MSKKIAVELEEYELRSLIGARLMLMGKVIAENPNGQLSPGDIEAGNSPG